MGGPGFAAVAAAIFAWQPAPDGSCQLTYSAAPSITEALVDRGFAFETYDRLCAAMREHGLELTITGTKGVLSERAFGWASVTARRTATGALSTREHVSTSLDIAATDDAATDMLYASVNDATNEMLGEMAEHLRSIETEEARMRAAYAAGRR